MMARNLNWRTTMTNNGNKIFTTALLALMATVPSLASAQPVDRAATPMTEDADTKSMSASAALMAPSNTVTISCPTPVPSAPPPATTTNISTGSSSGSVVQWKIVSGGSATTNDVLPTYFPNWTAQSVLAPAGWIQQAPTPSTWVPAANGIYVYQIKIVVQPNCAGRRVIVRGSAGAADSAVARLIKFTPGPFVGGATSPATLGATPIAQQGSLAANVFSVFNGGAGMVPGSYLLRFRVTHVNVPSPIAGNQPQGLIFNGTIFH
jgi:hypothetical protein